MIYDPELALWKPGRRSFLFMFGAAIVAPSLPDLPDTDTTVYSVKFLKLTNVGSFSLPIVFSDSEMIRVTGGTQGKYGGWKSISVIRPATYRHLIGEGMLLPSPHAEIAPTARL